MRCYPPVDKEWITLDIHGFSNNYMYQHSYSGVHRTKAYNNWIRDFHNLNIPSKEDYERYLDINFDEPIELFIRYTCKEENDIRNFDKSFIDQLFNIHFCVDDNIVHKVTSEKVGSCNTYDDGKIIFALRNIE